MFSPCQPPTSFPRPEVHGLPPLPVLERGWHHLGLHLRGVRGGELPGETA